MTNPEGLRPGGAENLLSVQRAAASFIESTRRAAAARERELDDVARLLAPGDAGAAEQIISSSRAATEQAGRRAADQAQVVTRAASQRVLRMVARYAGTLGPEARRQNETRSGRQAELIDGIARVHGPAAQSIRDAIELADAARLETAARAAQTMATVAAEAMRRHGLDG